ncbi:MAG TPA: aldehyde reductase [Nevskiaceae bacterium]|nr:aldehyde reductase [Nevskiaceae bacterium]
MSATAAPVLVTGAAGYVASWIVRRLLEQGYRVHGTVRDPAKPRGLEHLHRLAEQYPGQLTLFAADLLQPGSFAAAMQGCEVVMHTASPFITSGFTDAEAALVRPAVEGTRNVLETCNTVASVRRVVLTSSVVAIYGDNADAGGRVLTEADWNTSSSLHHQPYPYSKVCAEREAWKIHDAQTRWRLVTINPGLVLGPALTRASDSYSFTVIRQLVNGTMFLGAPPLDISVVDVRDVAEAHLRAAFTPAAEGRYITAAATTRFLALGRLLRKRYGSRYLFPLMEAPKPVVWLIAPLAGLTRGFVRLNVGHPLRLDNRRSREGLGLHYRSLEDTVVDHFEQLLTDGVIRRR